MNPRDVLPQRYPFQLLDHIVEWQAGVSAVALRRLTHDDPLLDAHGEIAAVLLIEAMAQCAGVAVGDPAQRSGGVLVRVDRFRCRRGAAAGDSLRIVARVVRVFGRTVKAHAVVHIEHRVVAAAELTLQKTPVGAQT